MTVTKTIGSTLKNLRENRLLLLQNVSDSTKINFTILSRIENNKRLPTKEQLITLCSFYNVSQNEIISQWLSDKILHELQGEDFAMEAMHIAGRKLKDKLKHK